MSYDPIQGQGQCHGRPKFSKMTDFLRRYEWNQKTIMVNYDTSRLQYLNLTGQIFDSLFVLVRCHVTFKLRLFDLWKTNFVSYQESTGCPVHGANYLSLYLQCESSVVFWYFFPNGWEFVINFLHTYYTVLYTLDDKFLFNYFQLWQSYAILSATTRRIFYISL